MNVDCSRAGKAPLWLEVSDPSSKIVFSGLYLPSKWDSTLQQFDHFYKNGVPSKEYENTIRLEFRPEIPGIHKILIEFGGKPIPQCPLEFLVKKIIDLNRVIVEGLPPKNAGLLEFFYPICSKK